MLNKLTPLSKGLLAAVVVGVFIGGKFLYEELVPKKVKASEIVQVDDLPPLEFDKGFAKAQLLPQPSTSPAVMAGITQIRAGIMGWNAQSGVLYANGGPVTTEGSLMQSHNVNLKLLVQNDCMKQGDELYVFVEDYAKGNKHSQKGYNMIAWMGDGVPSYLPSLNDRIKKNLGEEWIIQVFGSFGSSYGEDKFMGPIEAKSNPQALRGAIIIGVLRDGDWNIAMKYCYDNGIPVNNDPTTYDPNALNWLGVATYTEAAEMFVLAKADVRKIVRNGVLSKKDTSVVPSGVVTWFPGDKVAAEKRGGVVTLASTKDYAAQMPNTWLASKKWMADNSLLMESFILAGLKGGDQVKSHSSALVKASQISQEVYADANMTAKDWESAYKTYFYTDSKGNRIEIGGSRVWNLADNAQYFGLNGSPDIYKDVYETFGDICVKAYPEVVPSYSPYSEVVNLTYLTKVYNNNKNNVTVTGLASKPKFKETDQISSIVSAKAVSIEFKTGSAVILPKSIPLLQQLAKSATIADALLIEIDGHCDNMGNSDSNLELSKARANAVKQWFLAKNPEGFANRITANGYGDTQPIADNNTEAGRQKNRRVEIKMGK
jgi:OOP family OmpA-OmpF porin